MPRDKGKRRAYHKEYMREYMKRPGVKEKHLRRVKANQKKYRALNQLIVAEFRAEGCAYCPERDPACLQAHHLDPEKKDIAISHAVAMFSERNLRAEIAKCICVCANCHFKIHAGRVMVPRMRGAGGDASSGS